MRENVVDRERIAAALERIRAHVERTPVRRIEGTRLWLKCENRQITGSFKVRGAINKTMCLSRRQLARGLVTASAGNHGLGVSYAAQLMSATATVVLPRNAVPEKVEAIKARGGVVKFVSGGYAVAEAEGKRMAERVGGTWISPYNDAEVIAGQGTVGLEIGYDLGLEGEEDAWEVFVPVGGGGLVCGIGLAVRGLAPEVRIIGVQPEASAYLYAHFKGLNVGDVEERATLADGLAGPVEEGSITFDLLPRAVDDMVLVGEEQIEEAIRWAERNAGERIEPAAGVGLAGWMAHSSSCNGVVVLSGGNIHESLRDRILSEDG